MLVSLLVYLCGARSTNSKTMKAPIEICADREIDIYKNKYVNLQNIMVNKNSCLSELKCPVLFDTGEKNEHNEFVQEISNQKTFRDQKTKDEIEAIGKAALEKTALLILSGGQGTRLGFDKPKGCFTIPRLNKTIFQIHFEKVHKIETDLNKKMQLLISTSDQNWKHVFEYVKSYNSEICSCENVIYLESAHNKRIIPSLEVFGRKKTGMRTLNFEEINLTKANLKDSLVDETVSGSQDDNTTGSQDVSTNPQKCSQDLKFDEEFALTELNKDEFLSFEHSRCCKGLNVCIFKQVSVESLQVDKKPFENVDYVPRNPSGNGAVIYALNTSNVLKKLKDNNFEYLNVVSVDNILANGLDALAIGLMKLNNFQILSKAVQKREGESAGGFQLCSNGFLVKEYLNGPIDSQLANICNHTFSLDFIKEVQSKELKVNYIPRETTISRNGEEIRTECLKPEYFIFDFFEFTDRSPVLLVERSKEFSPVKNGNDKPNDNPETAASDYLELKEKQKSSE